MQNKINGKVFVKKTMKLLIIMLSITAFLAYILDPIMYYRIANYKTYCTEQYTTSGLLKNSPAEIAIVGSSMMQNTNIELVEELFNKEAVKYTRSGMNIDEIIMLVDKAILENNNVEKFIINLDISMFNSEDKSPYNKFPKYIYDENKINDIKYLLGYDIWFKFIPFNIFYNLASKIDSPITNKIKVVFRSVTDIEMMGNWGKESKFSEEMVKNNYINGIASVSKQNSHGMLERMKERFDKDFYPLFENNPQKIFNFIFPPYSSLMWYNAEKEGYLEMLLSFKKYIVEKFEALENVVLYDFQDHEKTMDLNNYKDSTHYTYEFNNMMMAKIKEKSNIINLNNVDIKIHKLKENLNEFKFKNNEWISLK